IDMVWKIVIFEIDEHFRAWRRSLLLPAGGEEDAVNIYSYILEYRLKSDDRGLLDARLEPALGPQSAPEGHNGQFGLKALHSRYLHGLCNGRKGGCVGINQKRATSRGQFVDAHDGVENGFCLMRHAASPKMIEPVTME